LSSVVSKNSGETSGKPSSTIDISRTSCREDPIFDVITRGDTVIGEDRVTPGKTTEESGVRRVTEKTQLFDPRKEKQIFEEARREFGREHAYSSKAQPEVKECGIPPGIRSVYLTRRWKRGKKPCQFLVYVH
jgi:hypothetical protein